MPPTDTPRRADVSPERENQHKTGNDLPDRYDVVVGGYQFSQNTAGISLSAFAAMISPNAMTLFTRYPAFGAGLPPSLFVGDGLNDAIFQGMPADISPRFNGLGNRAARWLQSEREQTQKFLRDERSHQPLVYKNGLSAKWLSQVLEAWSRQFDAEAIMEPLAAARRGTSRFRGAGDGFSCSCFRTNFLPASIFIQLLYTTSHIWKETGESHDSSFTPGKRASRSHTIDYNRSRISHGRLVGGRRNTATSKTKPGKKPAAGKKPSQSSAKPKTAEPKTLLTNPGFENGTDAPQGWEQGADIPGVTYLWDKSVAHTGKASLCLKKTARRYFPVAQWFQTVPCKPNAVKIKISGWIKAEGVTKATLDAQFTEEGGTNTHKWAAYIGAKNSGDPPADHDWKLVEGEADVPAGTKEVTVALQIWGPGTVWLDDIRADFVTEADENKNDNKTEGKTKDKAADRSDKPTDKSSKSGDRPINTNGISNNRLKDSRVAWLQANAVPIRSLDPDAADFTDLMPLIAMIGKARVVQLGEQSHGDGATFAMKCRLARFLHEKCGFDVLAWESGLFDCQQMEAALHTALPLQAAIERGIFPIWSVSGQVTPIFRYARSTYATPHPLIMAGFDCQFSTNDSALRFAHALDALQQTAQQASIPLVTPAQWNAAQQMTKQVSEEKERTLPAQVQAGRDAIQALGIALADNKTALQKADSRQEVDFWRQSLRSLLAFVDVAQQNQSGQPENINVRDHAMAENLLWLVHDRYPNKKIIVWAASFHLMRNASQVESLDKSVDYASTVPMGQTVYDALKDEVYTIAFTAYQGAQGNPFFGEHPLTHARPDTFESLCHSVSKSYLLVDLRHLPSDSWLRQPVDARPLGYSPMRARWPDVFDAILFTDRMFPSAANGRLPKT